MARYFGYARVSTLGQSDTSIDVQLEFLRQQAENLGMEFVPVHEKRSGKSVEGREMFKAVMSQLRTGDVLGVFDNSRLGRNTEENLAVVRELSGKGVRVQIAGSFIDTEKPQDELLFSVESAVSTFQRKLTLQKSKASLKKLEDEGKRIFKGSLFGWEVIKKSGKTYVSKDPKAERLIRKIYGMYLSGMNFVEISKALDETEVSPWKEYMFNDVNIKRLIFRPQNMGYYLRDWHGKTYEHCRKIGEAELRKHLVKSVYYEPLVDEQTWWAAYRQYEKSYSSRSGRTYEMRFSDYMLSGVLRCGYCGSGYVHTYIESAAHNLFPRYVCYRHRKTCGLKVFRPFKAPALEYIFMASFLITYLSGYEIEGFFRDRVREIEDDLEAERSKISEIDAILDENAKKTSRLVDAIENGLMDISDIRQRLLDLKAEKESLSAKKANIEDSISKAEADAETMLEKASEDSVEMFLKADTAARRKMLSDCVESALVYEDRLEIRFFNGKTFSVAHMPMKKKGMLKQDFSVSFNGEHQYDGSFDTGARSVKVNAVRTGDGFRDHAMIGYVKVAEQVNGLLKDMPMEETLKNSLVQQDV